MTLLERLIAFLLVRVAPSLIDRIADPDFQTRSLPAREKLRVAANAREARDASKAIHQLLAGGE